MTWQENVQEIEELQKAFRSYPPTRGEVRVASGRCHYYDLQPSDERNRYSARLFVNTPSDDGEPGRFGPHGHGQREWIIVVDGYMNIQVIDTGETRQLNVGDYIVLGPGVEHDAVFPVECTYAVITVPATKDW